MKCCACLAAEVVGYINEEGDSMYWALCLACMDMYDGQGYLLGD
jgi:hypothetical protein